MKAPPLFAYGTLQDRDILAALLGRSPPPQALVPAHLAGFAALYYPGRLYPGLAPRPGASAPGIVILDLDEADLARLDAFEGEEYRRGPVFPEIASGPLPAQAYLPAIDMPANAPEWTLADWRRRHKPIVLAQELELARKAGRAAS